MRVENPNYVAPAPDANAPHVKHSAAVRAVIDAASTDKATLTFDEIRAALPKAKRDELTDGELHQLLLDAGLKVST